jgi:hypothetical protein
VELVDVALVPVVVRRAGRDVDERVRAGHEALGPERQLHLALEDVVELVDGMHVVGRRRRMGRDVAADHRAALARVQVLPLVAVALVGVEVDLAQVVHWMSPQPPRARTSSMP